MKIINSKGTPEVWLSIGILTWSRLPAHLKTDLLGALDRIAQIREHVARCAKVQPMPPVEVVGQIWVTDNGIIDGTTTPLRFQKMVVFGARVPVLTAMCTEETVVRKVLVHEFLHCFYYTVKITEAVSRGDRKVGETGTGHNAFDASDDASRLENPADWVGDDDVHSFALHNDAALDMISHRYDELKPHFPALVPDLRFRVEKCSVAESTSDHAKALIRRRGGVERSPVQ